MASQPISARLPQELRQELARHCLDRDINQTEAIAEGLRLLLGQSAASPRLTREQAAQGLAELERALAEKLAGFDAEAAEAEGRD